MSPKKGLKIAIAAIMVPFALVLLYLLAALAGGLVKHYPDHRIAANSAVEEPVAIYLLSNLLHVDIALPATPEIVEMFGFLDADGFPLRHPELRYIVIGWGAREFYTSTKTLRDIGPTPLFSAITGDNSVMHFIPAKDLSAMTSAGKILVSRNSLLNMAREMGKELRRNSDGLPQLLKGKSHGLGDLFYQAKGNFNVFNPCNVWAAKILRSGGVTTGIWTPTAYSLLMSVEQVQGS